jgi:RNA polymerase sigma-70 factor (ECF subfamily)
MDRRKLALVRKAPADARGDADSSLTDDQYVAAVQRGDEKVFTQLVREYSDRLTRFAFSVVDDEDAAHDITQEVFARVWQLGSHWQPRGTVSAYLFIAIRHGALSHLRSTRARTRAQETLRAHFRTLEAGADPYFDVTLAHRINEELRTLTERQRNALHLRYGQGQSLPQVAAILGIDLRAAERLVVRALTALRAKLPKTRDELE